MISPVSRLFLCAAGALAATAPGAFAGEDFFGASRAPEESAPVETAASAVNPVLSATQKKPLTSADRAVIAAWWENDFLWSDKYYTNGLKFAYTSPELFTDGRAPEFLRDLVAFTPLASPDEPTPAGFRFHAALSQEIYTPEKSLRVNPPPGDRPYDALLYAGIGVSSETDYRLDVLELSLGIAGHDALGEQVQNNYHRLIGDDVTRGWDTVRHSEPLVQLSWERRWRIDLMREDTFGIDVVPHMHWEVGTEKIYGTAGAQFRFGWNLPADFGTDFARSTTGTTRPARNFDYNAPMRWTPDSVYFLLDLQGEGWAWNSSLDGSHWYDDGRSVSRESWVGQFAAGIAAQWGGLRVSITETLRTKEFSGQDHEVFVFTSFNVGYVF